MYVSNFHASVVAIIWKIGRPMKLETERLVIDHLTMPDLDAFAAMEADEQVRRYIDGKTRTRAQTADYIGSMLQSYETRGYGRYAVRSKADKSLIGICGFIDEEYGIDFGYRYARAAWGQGIATEAGSAVMSYGEKVLRLTPVIALAMPANTGSTGVLAKLDFSFVGPVTVMGIPALKYMKKIEKM